MSRSNSPTSFLYDDKLISDHNFAMKYIKERSEKASTIQNILAPITAQDEFIFDIPVDDNASEVSELSDPFAELGGNIISSAESQQKRRLSKIEADVLVMNSFPATHMKIQNELIKEVEIPFPPQLDIDSILEGKRDSEFEDENDAEFFQQISESLDQVGIQKYNEEKKKSEDKEKNRQKTKQKRNQDDQEADSSSLMSGIWRMLGQ